MGAFEKCALAGTIMIGGVLVLGQNSSQLFRVKSKLGSSGEECHRILSSSETDIDTISTKVSDGQVIFLKNQISQKTGEIVSIIIEKGNIFSPSTGYKGTRNKFANMDFKKCVSAEEALGDK